MMRRRASAHFLVVLVACNAEVGDPGPLPRNAGAEGQAAAVPVSAEPDLAQMVMPTHTDAMTWGFPAGDHVTGQGPCAGVTLSSVLERIRAGVPAVRHIQTFRSLGARGATMNPGSPTPIGEPPPVPTEKVAYVAGFMDARSFGAAFHQGERCRGDVCEDRRYWYFETDEQCRPRWVGHHHAVEKPGGRYGTCFDVVGTPLWSFPGSPAPRRRCDADWSPQDISGVRKAFSLDPLGTCSTIEASIVPVELTIVQAADRGSASVTFTGTGIPFVDGRAFAGKVERQAFTTKIAETTTAGCPVQREITINLDFEAGPSINAVPGGFGLVDIAEQPLGACPQGGAGCSASLHLIRGD